MLEFKPITIDDQQFLTERLVALDCKLLNYNFVTLFIYRNLIQFEYTMFHDFLIIKTTIQEHDCFLFPTGTGDRNAAFDAIKEYAFSKEDTCRFLQFCDHNAHFLKEWSKPLESQNYSLNFYKVRGDFEYIYLTQNLIELQGHDYKVKRNHVNHFKNHYQWAIEPITKENLAEVIAFSKEWDVKLEIAQDSRLIWENIALDESFNNYFTLGLEGILMRAEGKIVAFSFGCPLCKDTYLVLFEKADRDTNGSYAMINQSFASTVGKNYLYLNRAEDCGNEGLRKAKLSYNPTELLEVWHLDIKKIK
ncbi:MAG: phosphatidylglycerol lysyltransferase domain-containing protein [Bacteroidales bacterium]|jgi:hypothetical protein|nr:phosphatidylglycerol lysyltransferase domain-containing protein [Bacteroidales bacterium]